MTDLSSNYCREDEDRRNRRDPFGKRPLSQAARDKMFDQVWHSINVTCQRANDAKEAKAKAAKAAMEKTREDYEKSGHGSPGNPIIIPKR